MSKVPIPQGIISPATQVLTFSTVMAAQIVSQEEAVMICSI
jgi:hypothetical protein